MRKILLTTTAAIIMLSSSLASAADARRRSGVAFDESAVRLLAARYAAAKTAASVCRVSDGVGFNGQYFAGQIAALGGRSKAVDRVFKSEVIATKSRIASQIAQSGASDWCDDYLDGVADQFGTSYPDNTQTPVFWADASGLYGGPGMGNSDPFVDFGDDL